MRYMGINKLLTAMQVVRATSLERLLLGLRLGLKGKL